MKIKQKLMLILVIISTGTIHQSCNSGSGSASEWYTVTPVEAENGTYTISPQLPEDGRVQAGTQLTITANPGEGYSLDCIYYTIQEGKWGSTDLEFFVPQVSITVDKDMKIGAVFIESSRVENIQVIQDVVYAQPGVKPLKYDVFSPLGARDLPCIIIVHGGAWSWNNENIMRGLARELVKDGRYVAISIDYRWVNTQDGDTEPNYMHELINDVFGAIAHIQEHAAEYGVDPTRIAITGDSAGGHLSASAAVFSNRIGSGGFGVKEGIYEYLPSYIPQGKTVEQVRDEITLAIRAAAPSYGPFDARNFADYVVQTDESYINAISPIKNIPDARKRAIPHFMVLGTDDPVISDEMVRTYADALTAAGQKAVYIQVEGAGHAFFDWKPDSVSRAIFAQYGIPWAAEMKAFFDSIFY